MPSSMAKTLMTGEGYSMTDKERIAELQRTIGLLIDVAEPQGNGESLLPTDTIEDAREVAFGVRGEIDE